MHFKLIDGMLYVIFLRKSSTRIFEPKDFDCLERKALITCICSSKINQTIDNRSREGNQSLFEVASKVTSSFFSIFKIKPARYKPQQ